LRSKDPGTEKGSDFEHWSNFIANLDREKLISRAFNDRIAGSVGQRAERCPMCRSSVWQFDAFFDLRKTIH
jgi:hypothetical protein